MPEDQSRYYYMFIPDNDIEFSANNIKINNTFINFQSSGNHIFSLKRDIVSEGTVNVIPDINSQDIFTSHMAKLDLSLKTLIFNELILSSNTKVTLKQDHIYFFKLYEKEIFINTIDEGDEEGEVQPIFITEDLPDNNISIIEYNGVMNGQLIIPDKIDGKTVTKIGDEVFKNNTFTSITLNQSLQSIGSKAFEYSNGITSITIPNSVNEIKSYAFKNCNSLSNIHLGTGLKTIESYVFEEASQLKYLIIPSAIDIIESYAFYNSGLEILILIQDSSITIKSNAFDNNVDLNSVTYNSEVYLNKDDFKYHVSGDVDDNAFINTQFADNKSIFITHNLVDNNISITEYTGVMNGQLIIPDEIRGKTVTQIGDEVFKNNTFTSIALNQSLQSIGSNAFEYSNGITSITIPNSVNEIKSDAFHNSSGLKTIVLPDGITVEANAFKNNDNLISVIYNSEAYDKSIVLHYSNEKIDKNAFIGCEGFYVSPPVNYIKFRDPLSSAQGKYIRFITGKYNDYNIELINNKSNVETPLHLEIASALGLPDTSTVQQVVNYLKTGAGTWAIQLVNLKNPYYNNGWYAPPNDSDPDAAIPRWWKYSVNEDAPKWWVMTNNFFENNITSLDAEFDTTGTAIRIKRLRLKLGLLLNGTPMINVQAWQDDPVYFDWIQEDSSALCDVQFIDYSTS